MRIFGILIFYLYICKKGKYMKKMNFNVLHLNYNKNEVEPYDILPYFRNCWKAKCYKDNVTKIKEAKSKNKRIKLLKNFIQDKSLYMFWARCEWEFLVAHWPFGSKQMYEDLKKFWKDYPDIDGYTNRNMLDNIIIQDMDKIDVHKQIMMNIDIITDILYKEFFKEK